MTGFEIHDRRGQARGADLSHSRLTRNGMSVQRAKEETGLGLPFQNPNRNKPADEQTLAHLKAQKLRSHRMQRSGSLGSAPSMQMATGRPRDPMWYWKQNNIPFNFADPTELHRIREFCRLLYVTHPLIAACVDIFSKFPLQGMHMECKDDQLTDFYSDLFLDQLKYEDHLTKMNREYWLVGETWSLGGWNETLGIWEGDEVINPDNVEVESSALLGEPRFLMQLPESLRTILQTRAPRWQYQQLIEAYPELLDFIGEDDRMPVSNIILKQLRFDADTFSNRGIPILMRGMRTIIQEEMLMSAMDAIADRLYTPLILTKLGATAQDLGTTVPWIPDADEMEEFNAALDAALAADFRALTYHWAIDMQPVLGRENVPDLTADFERIDDRLLMVWGLSRTMLTGASAGETYAADALNRDVVTQLLTHDQRMLIQFYEDRARIVAEAQEHYDYEVRGGKRYLITEDIYEYDEETGEGKIIQKPKLLIPDMKFKILNLADEQTDRDFRESLNEAGVPIPYKARVQGLGMDFNEMIEQRSAEEVQLTVAQAETEKKKYLGLKASGLPIPDNLRAMFDPKAIEMGGQSQMTSGNAGVTPSLGQIPLDLPGLAPTVEDVQGELGDPGTQANELPPGQDQDGDGVADIEEQPQEGDDVPPESNEQRGRMPKDSALHKSAAPLPKFGIRRVTAQRYVEPDNSEEERPRDFQPSGRFGAPRHVGMSYYLADDIPDEVKAKIIRTPDQLN